MSVLLEQVTLFKSENMITDLIITFVYSTVCTVQLSGKSGSA